MKMLFSPLVLLALAAAAFGVAVLAADLGIAAWQFGPDYVRRLVLWQHPSPLDRQRFPVRAIAAPAVPSPCRGRRRARRRWPRPSAASAAPPGPARGCRRRWRRPGPTRCWCCGTAGWPMPPT
ncbi:hypothetical protein ACFQY5_16765 [Paeniroseomonas aquatica]|uniref:hypothetical protein n=1 Tax=Paeniroseomonas aquatica TaxID=373043 RepID=UPI003621933D